MTDLEELAEIVKNQLRVDEGFHRFPYHDTVGKLTIGYGRNLDDVGIRQTEAEYMLNNDVYQATSEVYKALPWAQSLDIKRQAILVNMAFNMGISRLLTFRKMLTALQSGNYDLAAQEMLDSKWASQVGARAVRLAETMR